MARDTDHLAGGLDTENTGGLLTGFLAEEEEFERRKKAPAAAAMTTTAMTIPTATSVPRPRLRLISYNHKILCAMR